MTYDNLALDLGAPSVLLGTALIPSDPARLRQVRAMLAADPAHHQALEHLAVLAVRLTGSEAAGIMVIDEHELVHRARAGCEGPVVGSLEEPIFQPVFSSGMPCWVTDAEPVLGVPQALLLPVCTQAGQVALLWAVGTEEEDGQRLAWDLRHMAVLVAREVEHAAARYVGGRLLDERTGLYNMRGYETLAEQMLQLSRRQSEPASVILVSLESEADAKEHAVEFARVLRTTFRDSDVLARLQGAEFAALVTRCDLVASRSVIQRLRREMQMVTDKRWEGVRLVAGVVADDGESTLQDLLADAVCNMFRERPLRLVD